MNEWRRLHENVAVYLSVTMWNVTNSEDVPAGATFIVSCWRSSTR